MSYGSGAQSATSLSPNVLPKTFIHRPDGIFLPHNSETGDMLRFALELKAEQQLARLPAVAARRGSGAVRR